MDAIYLSIGLIPIGGGLIVVFVSIMSRLTRIETDIRWIKKALNSSPNIKP